MATKSIRENASQLSNYRNPDNDPRGPWNSAAYTCAKTAEERPNLYYPIINPHNLQKSGQVEPGYGHMIATLTSEMKNSALFTGDLRATPKCPELRSSDDNKACGTESNLEL